MPEKTDKDKNGKKVARIDRFVLHLKHFSLFLIIHEALLSRSLFIKFSIITQYLYIKNNILRLFSVATLGNSRM